MVMNDEELALPGDYVGRDFLHQSRLDHDRYYGTNLVGDHLRAMEAKKTPPVDPEYGMWS